MYQGPEFDGIHLYKVVSMLASKECNAAMSCQNCHFRNIASCISIQVVTFEHFFSILKEQAKQDLLEDTRADRIYRLFLESSAMQAHAVLHAIQFHSVLCIPNLSSTPEIKRKDMLSFHTRLRDGQLRFTARSKCHSL